MPAPDDVLNLEHVVFRRDGRMILDDISLRVGAGEHWALIGPNGAGKSTILSMCAATAHPTSGAVWVLGERIGRVDLATLRRGIGHVNPRHDIRSEMSALDVILSGFTATIERAMRWTPTDDEIARAHALATDVGLQNPASLVWPTMSQGERGRALVARALTSAPRLVLLDEPTTGLDVAAREQLLETLDVLAETAPDVATVLVTHHLEELPASTGFAHVIAHGRTVASGRIDEVLTTDVISRAFEHPIRVTHDDGRWSARAVRTRA